MFGRIRVAMFAAAAAGSLVGRVRVDGAPGRPLSLDETTVAFRFAPADSSGDWSIDRLPGSLL